MVHANQYSSGGEAGKKVLCAFPPAMLAQVDYVAQAEHRTRSDLIREATRRYVQNFKATAPIALPASTPSVADVIE